MSSEFKIDSRWPVLPLADVVYFQEGPGLRNWQYRQEGIPFVNIRCIRDGRLLRGEMTCLDPEEVQQKYQHFLLDAGDFVVSSSGTLGRLAEVQHRDLPCMLNTSVIRFRPQEPDLVDRRYLRYFLSSSLFEQQILAFANGSAQLNYGPSHLKRMGIVVPPMATQRTIGQVLGALDDRITLLRETNATLEAIAQALFKSWFVDFDPVRAKMAGRAPEGMDEATAALFPDAMEETELGLVPRGWSFGAVTALAVLNPESWSAKRHPGRVLYVDLANTKDNQIEGLTEFGFDEAPSRARRILRLGDVIVGTVRPGNRSFARVSIDSPLLTGSTGFAVLRAKEEFDQALVYLATTNDDAIDRLAHLADGGAYPAVRPEVVASTPLVIPPREVRETFGDLVNHLLASVGSNQEQCRYLADLRDTLLPRLISGQLRLPDAQAQLEDALA